MTHDITQVSFRDVLVFLMLVKRRSITAVAIDLDLTQSGMSRTIQNLEETAGAQLFTRHRQGLTLTDAGVAFNAYARPLAQSYVDAIACVRSGLGKRTTLAISNIITPLVLPDLLRSMTEGQAIDQLVLNDTASHQVVALVASGAADLGLCMMAVDDQKNNIEVIPLLSAPMGLLASTSVRLPQSLPNHAAIGQLLRKPRLPHQPMLQFARLKDEMLLSQALLSHGYKHGIQFEDYFESGFVSSSMSALFAAVAGGQLITHTSAVAAHTALQPLQFLPLPHLLPALQLCVVGRQGSNWKQQQHKWVKAIIASIKSVAWPDSITHL